MKQVSVFVVIIFVCFTWGSYSEVHLSDAWLLLKQSLKFILVLILLKKTFT